MHNVALSGWLSANNVRKYPLADESTGVSTGGIPLPENLITDMSVTVDGTVSGAWLSGVMVDEHIITVTVSQGSNVVLIGTFLRNDIHLDRAYTLFPFNSGAAGMITFGTGVGTAPSTHLRFTEPTGRLHPSAVTYVGSGTVNTLRAYGGDVASAGHVVVRGNDGVTAVVSPGTLTLGLTDEARATLKKTKRDRTPPIHTINGVAPDDNGVITIRIE